MSGGEEEREETRKCKGKEEEEEEYKGLQTATALMILERLSGFAVLNTAFSVSVCLTFPVYLPLSFCF